jgi:hypothetical protein
MTLPAAPAAIETATETEEADPWHE